MGLIIGPTPWWQSNLVSVCPVGTTLPDGSRIICKAGGCAWIVAPCCTQVGSTWAGGQYNSTQVGNKCCICEWPGLNTQLINCGFNPCDWFVPSGGSGGQLNNPGYVCRSQWDPTSGRYWSSTEINASYACCQDFSNGSIFFGNKTTTHCVRAFRCVTY
jgi:hypothetical protein